MYVCMYVYMGFRKQVGCKEMMTTCSFFSRSSMTKMPFGTTTMTQACVYVCVCSVSYKLPPIISLIFLRRVRIALQRREERKFGGCQRQRHQYQPNPLPENQVGIMDAILSMSITTTTTTTLCYSLKF